MPEKAEAVPFGYGGTVIDQISYNAATDTLSWRYVISSTNTFGLTINVAFDPASPPSRFVGHTPANCAPAPSAGTPQTGPLTCLMPVFVGGTTGQLALNAQAVIPQTCTASSFTIPGLILSNWPGSGNPEPPILVPGPGAQVIPADTSLCPPTPTFTATPVPPTPVPPTPTPTGTPLPPAVVPVIPQVFQQPVGGIFNGSRNNTPTPVRPAVAAPAAVAPITAMPVLRPPSTGDAGLLTLKTLRVSAW